ncbi:J domain-containing protein [Mesobacillus thioparans]|uniref:J domain-containing protein n=1 Tax=Mesobacillus thioparans TaxID=370439 RepID=UPI0039EFC36A
MLTINEAAEQLSSFGINATNDEILLWIQAGQLKAEKSKRRNVSYQIQLNDMIEFIVQKQKKDITAELENSNRKNQKLNEELEILNTRLHIEQSKVRTLKKMLNAQIEASGTDPSKLEELLGLKRDASGPVLKKEFKKLLKALHPDRGGDERLFKVFRQHYEKLK